MTKKRLFTFAVAILSSIGFSPKSQAQKAEENIYIIPQVQEIEIKNKIHFLPSADWTYEIKEENPRIDLLISQLNESLKASHLHLLNAPSANKRSATSLKAIKNPSFEASEYRINVGEKGVQIQYSTLDALNYAIQTLRQIINKNGIPFVCISDSARFAYRGLMLDVSRHFMPKEFVFKLLDEMQRYKLNKFHWHLTDAGGWRLQIKKYPDLTRKTAYRTESDWTKWWVEGTDRTYLEEGTEDAYGGYYTQKDIKEIIAYAKIRGIEVIPEIEMPGHSEEVLHAYPFLSCSGKALKNESDFCAGNPEVYSFLENILDEVIDLFPSKKIHIGGDEASKNAWKNCPKCQALMKREGLKNVDELQSYFMNRIEKYVSKKGRKAVAWDEVLEGEPVPNVNIMSWRGESGGLKAASLGLDAIMTPGAYLYFDHYQADPQTEPEAIGGYTPIKRTYLYNPVPDSLPEKVKQHIIGLQANVWTEYMKTPCKVEYMIFPRLLALSEIAWTQPQNKSWDRFRERINLEVPQILARGINSYPLKYQMESYSYVDYKNHKIFIRFDTEKYPVEIHYRVDGKAPDLNDPLYRLGDSIAVSDSAKIVAAIFEDGKRMAPLTEVKADYHKGIGKTMVFEQPIRGSYEAGGIATALLDGYRGGITYMDGRWLGNTSETTGLVDLGKPTSLSHISTKCMHLIGPWVHMPLWVEVWVSQDGKHYESLGKVHSKTNQEDTQLRFETFDFYTDIKARYVKVHYEPAIKNKFMFIDELVIW